jgi:hypothetical protein
MPRTKDALTCHFERRRNRWFNQDPERKPYADIESFKSLSDLENYVKKHTAERKSLSLKQHVDNGGITLLYNGEEGFVGILNTVACSVDLFQGPTNWCTARPGNRHFDKHKADGPLYVINDKVKKKKYQLHFPSRQLFDENDEPPESIETIPTLKLLDVVANKITYGDMGQSEDYFDSKKPSGRQIGIMMLLMSYKTIEASTLVESVDDATALGIGVYGNDLIGSLTVKDVKHVCKFVTPKNVEYIVKSGSNLFWAGEFLSDEALLHRLLTYVSGAGRDKSDAQMIIAAVDKRLSDWAIDTEGPELYKRCMNLVRNHFGVKT